MGEADLQRSSGMVSALVPLTLIRDHHVASSYYSNNSFWAQQLSQIQEKFSSERGRLAQHRQ